MQVRREFTRCSWRSIAACAYIPYYISRFDNITDGYTFFESVQMGIVVIDIIAVPKTDTPASIQIPALQFDNTVCGRIYGYSIVSEDVSTFMNPSAAKSACISPCIAVAVFMMKWKRKERLSSSIVPNFFIQLKSVHRSSAQ